MKGLLSIFLIFLAFSAQTQQVTVAGRITASGKGISNASIRILNGTAQTTSDSSGFYTLFLPLQGSYTLVAEMIGYESFRKKIQTGNTKTVLLDILLKEAAIAVSDVVVTGTLKEVRKMESPVPVEVFTPVFSGKSNTQYFRCTTAGKWRETTAKL